MRIAVIDNYDSFVYNLVHYLSETTAEIQVFRNDNLKFTELETFDKFVLSPGPGLPDTAGMLKKIIEEFAGFKPMLGVCLGHQAIAEVFGGRLRNLKRVFHGEAISVRQLKNDELLFKNLPKNFLAGRYHSWIVENQLPDCLEATSIDENGLLMSMRHKNFDLRSVQFHPESILTPNGKEMIQNWAKNEG